MTTFREQAAIAWAASYRHHMHVTACAVEHAQELADACCRAWGHTASIKSFGSDPLGTSAAVCSRCGRDPNHPVPEVTRGQNPADQHPPRRESSE